MIHKVIAEKELEELYSAFNSGYRLAAGWSSEWVESVTYRQFRTYIEQTHPEHEIWLTETLFSSWR